jgi:hypothetical protein
LEPPQTQAFDGTDKAAVAAVRLAAVVSCTCLILAVLREIRDAAVPAVVCGVEPPYPLPYRAL